MQKAADIQEAAAGLSAEERADLVVFLLDSLGDKNHELGDEEAMRRKKELDSGAVTEMSEAEFWKACGRG